MISNLGTLSIIIIVALFDSLFYYINTKYIYGSNKEERRLELEIQEGVVYVITREISIVKR